MPLLSVVRRPFVAQNHAAWRFGLSFSFAQDQPFNPVDKPVDLVLLTGDHIAEIVDDAGEVGDFFFQMLHG